MKRYFLKFGSLLLFILSIISCAKVDNPGNDDNESKVLVLTPSSKEIVVGEDSFVNFTATYGEKDVTKSSSLQIFHSNEKEKNIKVEGGRWKIEKGGDYSFYALYSTDNGAVKSKSVIVKAVEDMNLYLKSSADVTIPGSSIDFSIFLGDKELKISDSKLKLYLKNGDSPISLESLTYSIEEVKKYEFYAVYNFSEEELVSEVKTIDVIEWIESPYLKRAFFIQFTGTWCKFCPRVGFAIYDYVEKEGTKNAIFVAAHVGDELSNLASTELDNKLKPNGYPTLLAGSLNTTSAINLQPEEQTADGIKDAVAEIMETPARTAIKVSSVAGEDGISINAQVLVNEDGTYGIGSMILEDGIYVNQSNTFVSSLFGDYNPSVHKNILHGASPLNKDFHSPLSSSERQLAKMGYNYSTFFPFNGVLTKLKKIENCSVVVYTYDIVRKKIDNAIRVKIGEESDYEYAE